MATASRRSATEMEEWVTKRQKRAVVSRRDQRSQTACFGMAGVELDEMYLVKVVDDVMCVSWQVRAMVELLWRCCCCCSCECLRLRE